MKRRIFGNADPQHGRGAMPRRLGLLTGAVSRGQAGQDAGSSTDELHLAERVLRDWAKGLLTSAQVQDYCRGGVVSGCDNASAKRFGGLGSQGVHKQNIQRDLMTALGRPKGMPEFVFVKVPVKGKHGAREELELPILMPHLLCASLYEERPDFFQAHVAGTEGEREECWNILTEQQFVRDVLRQHDASTATTVPMGLHCDAGAFTKKEGLYVLTWNSLVSQGRTLQKRFPIAMIKKSQLLPDGSTLDALWEAVAWSFNILATGCMPDKTWDGAAEPAQGKLLCGGWRGLCLQMRGDWQWMCQCFRFPQEVFVYC